MAQVKLLKVGAEGDPLEMDTAADDITLSSYTVTGGGPVLDGTTLDMNNKTITDTDNISFTAPSSDGLVQTAGTLAADDIMGKERENTMTTSGAVSFPVITDDAGEVDSFRFPALAGTPTATPTTGGEGHAVWDSSGNNLYIWDGAAWDNIGVVNIANDLETTYTADEALAIRDFLYISAADNVSKVVSTATATARAIGFAVAAASDTASVDVRTNGSMGGFSGFTAGNTQYADPATPGGLTGTLPVGTGNVIVKAGYAKNTTTIQIQIEQLGRRAS